MKDKLSNWITIKHKWKIQEYITINLLYYFFLVVGIIVILILLATIFCSNFEPNEKVIFTNLIMVITSFIVLIVNLIIRNNDNKMREKENYINLRFKEVCSGINELILYLQITFNVYEQICDLYNSNNPKKYYYLSPKGFLVMQFTNLTSNYTLLNKLPITLRFELEYEFYKREMPGLTMSYNELDKIMDFDYDINLIRNNIAYNKFIDEFKNNSDFEQRDYFFSAYFESKDITTEEYYKHFKRIFNMLCSNSIEELILKDRADVFDEKTLDKIK